MEDRRWCCLVVLVGDYLLVYFFLWSDVNSKENKGVQCRGRSVPDVNFVTENEYKLYNSPVPEGYVLLTVPSCWTTMGRKQNG
jgi:hypothetical protein